MQFKSYTEQYLDSTGIFKDVIISLLATLAKQEKVRQSERVKACLDRVKSQGIQLEVLVIRQAISYAVIG